jgi:rod shape-determining protein MreD
MLAKYFKFFIFALFLIIIQKTFIPLISIFSITPDLTFLLVVLIAITEGQISGIIIGFLIGFFIDLLSPSFMGLTSLSYSVGGFIAGYFYDEYKTSSILQSYFFIFIIFISSLSSNLVYFFFFIQGSVMDFWFILLKYGIGSTIYSLFIGVIMVFILSKRQLKIVQGMNSDD